MNNNEQISQLGIQLQTKFEVIAAAKTLRFVGGNFSAQGYQGNSFTPWAARKKQRNKDIGRALLIQSGRLRRGWNSRVLRPGKVKIFNDVPYAEIHNNGGTINKPSRKENIIRNRHKEDYIYKKGKNQGQYRQRKGQFAKGTTIGDGFSFKEHTIKIPRRQMLPTDDSDSPILRAAIERDLKAEMLNLENIIKNS